MENINLEPIMKLSKDLKNASKTFSNQEARYLVDTYYQIQDFRKTTANQIRSMEETGEPIEVMTWLLENMKTLENQIKNALDVYTKAHPVGQWLQSITGIGPVISAGLLAHIDIEKAPTAGHIWSFAGLDPTKTWDKGKLRPWNAKLKVICWKAGQSFVKVSNNDNDVYGKIYKQRKEYETLQNDMGAYKEQAAHILATKKIGKETEAYKSYILGKLPPAHIQARAERYAVKIFLSHLQEFWYEEHYGVKPPKPFAIAILGHAHQIPRP